MISIRQGDVIRILRGRLKGEMGPVFDCHESAYKFWNGDRWRWIDKRRVVRGDVELVISPQEEDRP